MTDFGIEENEKAIVIQRIYRNKKEKSKMRQSEDLQSPLPVLVVMRPIEEEQRLKEENEKATIIQNMYREKKRKEKEKQPPIDEVLGMPIDDEMQNKAAFIQRHYRKKREDAKKTKKPDDAEKDLSKKKTDEIDDENLISNDPKIRQEQEEKAAYIQKAFRIKQSRKMNPKPREQ